MIKWSRDLKRKYDKKILANFDKNLILFIPYRPFFRFYFYADKLLCDVLTQNHVELFGDEYSANNFVINIMGITTDKPFSVLASNALTGINYLGAAAGTTFSHFLDMILEVLNRLTFQIGA